MEYDAGKNQQFDTIREALKFDDKKLSMSKGFFVVLEGIDGCGKGTQARLLEGVLKEQYPNREIILIREPGSTLVGEQIRKFVLKDSGIIPEAAAYLFFAARAQLAYTQIVPALLRGAIVICERWMTSTVSYQGWGGEVAKQALFDAAKLVTDIVEPNLIVLLDIPTKLGKERQNKAAHKPDVFEEKDTYFQKAVRLGYENAKTCASVETISGEGSKEQVLNRLIGYVDSYMRRQEILNKGLTPITNSDARAFAAAGLRRITIKKKNVYIDGVVIVEEKKKGEQ